MKTETKHIESGQVKRILISLVVLLGMVLSTSTMNIPQVEAAASKIYYTTHDWEIKSADPDGSNPQVISILTDGEPADIALDKMHGKIYFIDGGMQNIKRINMDGSGSVEDVTPIVGDVVFHSGIALDVVNEKIYYTTDTPDYAVKWVKMDGSGGGVLYYSPGRPNDIALDLKHGKVYFVDGDNGKIVWMDLDGTDVQDLIPGQMDVWADNGIVLDVDGGKIYFTTWDPSDAVKSANLDGSNLQTLYSSPGRPGPITLDLTGGKLYFMDNDTWYVQRMDVGGGGIEDVITDSYVNGLALDPPVPTAIILDRFTGRSAYSLTEAGILLGLVVCLTGFFAVFKRRRDKMEGLC